MKVGRRKFIANTTKATLLTAIGVPLLWENVSACSAPKTLDKQPESFIFSQLKLPYTYNALEPSIDSKTMDIHYTKHQTAYLKNANDALAAENILMNSEKEFFAQVSQWSVKARNNGGGVWNHNFFWQSMRPWAEDPAPTGKINDVLSASFGSLDSFKQQFTQAALGRFGSGWAWLVKQEGRLKIGSTPNQDNPLMDVSELRGEPLLTLDVWEHAYYLKYQNNRSEYITNWWNVVNWDEVAGRL